MVQDGLAYIANFCKGDLKNDVQELHFGSRARESGAYARARFGHFAKSPEASRTVVRGNYGTALFHVIRTGVRENGRISCRRHRSDDGNRRLSGGVAGIPASVVSRPIVTKTRGIMNPRTVIKIEWRER